MKPSEIGRPITHGYRHYLAGQPVHCGDMLELCLAGMATRAARGLGKADALPPSTSATRQAGRTMLRSFAGRRDDPDPASLKLQLDVVDRSHDEMSELAVKVFELSQDKSCVIEPAVQEDDFHDPAFRGVVRGKPLLLKGLTHNKKALRRSRRRASCPIKSG